MTGAVEVMADAIASVNDEYNLSRDQAEAALDALEAAGFVVVPKAPTEAMRIAAVNTGLPGIGEPPLYEKIYTAMIQAARLTP